MGRRLGQHFLARQSILDRIADIACGVVAAGVVTDGAGADSASGGSGPAALVIEIGPGRGALTGPLLARAGRVVAIEVDPVLVHYLQQKFRDQIDTGRLTLVEGDVLKADFAAHLGEDSPGPQVAIVGNLPYYITSPILEKVLSSSAAVGRAVFMMQREVAERVTANPGSRDYGYLSVLAQVQASAELLFEVPRAAFRPPPKVDSAVVGLVPRDPVETFGITDLKAFLAFARAAFRQKRKTLRNNLAVVFDKEVVDRMAEGRMRAEQLSIGELARIERELRALHA